MLAPTAWTACPSSSVCGYVFTVHGFAQLGDLVVDIFLGGIIDFVTVLTQQFLGSICGIVRIITYFDQLFALLVLFRV